jgi:hypothetical protein
MISVLHTDDCMIYAKNTNTIDKFVKTVRSEYRLTLNNPDPIDDFLGIT